MVRRAALLTMPTASSLIQCRVRNSTARLQEVSRAARSIRILADYLERHPEALVRGKTGEAK